MSLRSVSLSASCTLLVALQGCSSGDIEGGRDRSAATDAATSSSPAAVSDASTADSASSDTPPASDAAEGGRAGANVTVGGSAAAGRGGSGGQPEERVDASMPEPPPDPSALSNAYASMPWGVASSASSSRMIDSWTPRIAESGVRWVRGFDDTLLDTVLKATDESKLALTGILLMDVPGTARTFPVDRLDQWRSYVTASVQNAKTVRFWEVWNEPPNFTENKAPEAYATIVSSAYEAAKAVDDTLQLGLAAQSVNINFLARAIDAGARDHFDYVTLHPYESLALVARGFDAQYMSIVPVVRKLLADKNPEKKDVPVYFTELGEPVGPNVTAEQQADTLVKAYTMGLAQGVARVHWFEPLDGDSGAFGLLDAKGPRPSYKALTSLIKHLGEAPRYSGWIKPTETSLGFVFEGSSKATMVVWSEPDAMPQELALEAGARVVKPHSGDEADASSLMLSTSPAIVVGISSKQVDDAKVNAGKLLPWHGDYASSESITWSAATGDAGLHPTEPGKIVTVGNVQARDASFTTSQRFTVDPAFNLYTSQKLEVTLLARRNGDQAADVTLMYESTTGWKAAGERYDVPGGADWATHTWVLEDAQLVGMFGYHLDLHSESEATTGYSYQSLTVKKL